MKKIAPLNPANYRIKLVAKTLPFRTTAELAPLIEFLGQTRALKAIHFGIGIKNQGYNLYAMGPPGIGKFSLVRTLLEEKAKHQETVDDWCYIHNFDQPEKPIAISLPPGKGIELQTKMKNLMDELSHSLIATFESDEYRKAIEIVQKEFETKRLALQKQNAEVISSSKLHKLLHKKERAIQHDFASKILSPMIIRIKKSFFQFPTVLHFLDKVQEDIIEHVNDLFKHDEHSELLIFNADIPGLSKYYINLLVNNQDLIGAPVIFEEKPCYTNLICRIEYVSQLGVMVTNFNLIRPGSLHRANGGYLIIEARKIKKDAAAWEALKRALYSNKIAIEPIEHMVESARPISLEPIPIPLSVKVILIGDRKTYYSLCQKDPDFNELFKVAVDFDEEITRDDANIELYCRLIATISRNENTRPLKANAVATIIDYSSRLAEDVEKLSTHMRSISDLVIEANYFAGLKERKFISEKDVLEAIHAQISRLDREKQLYYEEIFRQFILINLSGTAVGQVNCLSIVTIGNFRYGHPTRVTAKVRPGKAKLIDIQHEIKLAGPIHTKSGLTITSLIADKFKDYCDCAFTATISFEQIYGSVDGDSASIAEISALFSAISNIPLLQNLAVTGSINQYGDVQVVGGINEKIEGYFDVCKMQGLTGKHGIIIPAGNVKNLMLQEDIVIAAKNKLFSIYLVNHLDEALQLLTGLSLGEKNAAGEYPKGSLNHAMAVNLTQLSSQSKNFKKGI